MWRPRGVIYHFSVTFQRGTDGFSFLRARNSSTAARSVGVGSYGVAADFPFGPFGSVERQALR